jgi:hypothetical protein
MDWLAPTLILQSAGASVAGTLPAYAAPGGTFQPGKHGSFWRMFCNAAGYLAVAAPLAGAPTATAASFPVGPGNDVEPMSITEGTQFAFISLTGTATIGWVRCYPVGS